MDQKEYTLVHNLLEQATLLKKTSMTMEDIFQSITKRNLKNIAVEYYNEKKKLKHYKYSQMRSNSYKIASIIHNKLSSTPKRLPVILKCSNGPHWGEYFWAILMCGFKPLLIDAKASKEGVENLIKQSKAVAVVSDDSHDYSVPKINCEDISNEKLHKYNFTFTFAPDWENEVIFCSSGTTGDVKLMVYNGENLVYQICSSLDMCNETKDIMYPKKMGKVKILAMIPFHHVFGFFAVFLWYTFYGKTLVFPSSNAPSDITGICQDAKVTHVFSVPLFWNSLAQTVQRKFALMDKDKQQLLDKFIGFNTGKLDKHEAGKASGDTVRGIVQKNLLGKDIRFCISGGGYISNDTLSFINGIGYPLYNGYGMTEVGVTSVELSPEVQIRLKGKIGRPFHGVEYKIIPSEKSNPSLGELCIKSKAVHIREIIGGVERPADLDKDGFFHSGDIVEVDSTGEYSIKGRIKDIIINEDGENIFPDEIEMYFTDLPHVTHLCVLGVPSGKSNHENIALVLELDNKVTPEEIVELHKKIDNTDLPKGSKISTIYLAKCQLPLANNMKIKRFVVKKDIKEQNGNYIPIDTKRETKKIEGFDKQTVEEYLIPIRQLFSEVLILPTFKIEDDDHWINDLGGDSMSYIELVKKLEEKFNVTIDEDLYGKLTCVNDFTLEVIKIKHPKAKTKKK